MPPLWLYETCASTLTAAAELTSQCALPVWGSVLAARQTQGRGQLGRHWQSPKGNLYAALRLPDCPPFSENAVAPAVGALLATMLAQLGFAIWIKWPNDLVLATQDDDKTFRKVGGILIEERNGAILAGIGFNISSAPSDTLMRANRALPAGCLSTDSLRECGFSSLLDIWRYTVDWLHNQSLNPLSHSWLALAERRLLGLNQPVTLIEDPDTAPVRGRLLGLDPSGGVRLETDQGLIILTSGSLYCDRTHWA